MLIFPEPFERETRPAFADIPPAILEKISALLGARVAGGEVVHGGFSAAANFMLRLEDGRKIFAKGSHPDDDSHAVQNLRQEISVYQNAPVLREISPRYLGVVEDGDEDGWALGLWEWVDRAAEPPDVPVILSALHKWQTSEPFLLPPLWGRVGEGGLKAGNGSQPFISNHSTPTLTLPQRGREDKGEAAPFLKDCRAQNYISGFFMDEKKWRWIGENTRARSRVLSLFSDRDAGEEWLRRNLPALISLQQKVTNMNAPEGPLHGDLRLDNVFQDKTGRVSIVDWPNACRGPLVFDRVFLGASIEAQGLGLVEDALVLPLPLGEGGAQVRRTWEGEGTLLGREAIVPSPGLANAWPPSPSGRGEIYNCAESAPIIAAVLAGHFADHAGRAVPQKLPRLRWMQKSMLCALLGYLNRVGISESLPGISGKN